MCGENISSASLIASDLPSTCIAPGLATSQSSSFVATSSATIAFTCRSVITSAPPRTSADDVCSTSFTRNVELPRALHTNTSGARGSRDR